MTKAVFVDYMGTTVDEHSQEMGEIVRRICKNSAVHDPKQVQRFSLDNRRRYEADSYLDSYLTEDEIVDRLIADMEAELGLADDPAALRELIRRHWVNAPVSRTPTPFLSGAPSPSISSPTTACHTWSGPYYTFGKLIYTIHTTSTTLPWINTTHVKRIETSHNNGGRTVAPPKIVEMFRA